MSIYICSCIYKKVIWKSLSILKRRQEYELVKFNQHNMLQKYLYPNDQTSYEPRPSYISCPLRNYGHIVKSKFVTSHWFVFRLYTSIWAFKWRLEAICASVPASLMASEWQANVVSSIITQEFKLFYYRTLMRLKAAVC